MAHEEFSSFLPTLLFQQKQGHYAALGLWPSPLHSVVLGLGDIDEEVETFYNFWCNFDSWRSFECRVIRSTRAATGISFRDMAGNGFNADFICDDQPR